MDTPGPNLALWRREVLRSQFRADIASDTARPLVLPFDALGSFLIPLIYLCIPHTRRPWLYKSRFLVLALMVGLNLNIMMKAASTNMAVAYGTGLAAIWGILWGLTVLVWTRPQFEAARVERRRTKFRKENGSVNGEIVHEGRRRSIRDLIEERAPDETVAAALMDGYEYYWQAYPADEGFLTRLDWVYDYVTSFRGSGWTTAISPIPSFQRPDKPTSSSPVNLSSIPFTTRTGYHRHRTVNGFFRSRLSHLTLCYLILDFCIVIMRHDPYFIFGPDYSSSLLPPHLTSLPASLLEIYRTFLSFGIILSALYMLFSLGQVTQFLLSRRFPNASGCRGDLWQYPSVFGGFVTNILDHGLAGFWGGWWHQTFRMAFVAPTNYLVRHGILPKDKHHPLTQVVGSLVAFGQSSILHAAGSSTTLPKEARPSSPPVFFLSSLLGIMVQTGWKALLGKGARERCPMWLRRAGNLVFVLVWLHYTRAWFVDDLSRGAVWLFEPVPVSVVRMLGFGENGDNAVWRWGWDEVPSLWTEGRWWERGLKI